MTALDQPVTTDEILAKNGLSTHDPNAWQGLMNEAPPFS